MKIIHCTTEGCLSATNTKTPPQDPRSRWMFDLVLTDEDGAQFIVNLCPLCVEKYFNLDEEFFQLTEKTENFVRKVVGTVQ